MAATRDKSLKFIDWVTNGRTPSSPIPILEVLKSEKTAREHPDIYWSTLKLLMIGWADEYCSRILRSGSSDFFADIGQLYKEFLKHWSDHHLDFIAVYPEANEKWTPHQLNYLPQCLFEILLDDLAGSKDRFEAKMIRPYDRQRIRSNAYELAHYFIHLRQRLDANAAIIDQPRLTHMLKVYSKERQRPKRNVRFLDEVCDYLLSIRFRNLASPEWSIIQQPQGRDWLLEVWEGFLNRTGIKEIAPFQLKCFKTLLDSALLEDGCPDPVMITAGTGFGKTEAFIFPILFYATINLLRQKSRAYGPDAILVYPRIDLCNNQLERYLWYAHCLKESVLSSPRTNDILENYLPLEMFRATLGHSGARTEDVSQAEPFKIECPICKGLNQEGFIKLRKNPEGYNSTPFCEVDEDGHDIKQYLSPELKRWASGRFSVAITTVDTLHRRLMDLHGKKTLWKNSSFLPRFIVLDEIHIYEGQTGSHVANLARRLKVYLKNIQLPGEIRRPNPRPPIFIGASATIGNPQEVGSSIFSIPISKMDNRVLKPEEKESEPLGREYIYLLKTPPIRETQDDNNGNPRSRVVSEQASLLQSLMAFWHGMRKTDSKYRLLTFVDSIDSVWRITKNLDDAENDSSKKIGLFKFRVPIGRWEDDIIANKNGIFCPRYNNKDLCFAPPHQFFEPCITYQQGECWWSMGESPNRFIQPMQVVGRISGYTRAPRNFPRAQSLDQWDCMIATSTLEVGFDHSELIATAQFKAPPNPASFQQRKGRGGRGVEDIPLTLMVLGNSPGDLFAFKHEQRYFDPRSEDLNIQFDAKNQFIRNQHVMSSCYDFMNWKGVIEASPDIYNNCEIHTALGYLTTHREELNNWITDLYINDGLTREDCSKLVSQCLEQMQHSVVSINIPGIFTSIELFRREIIPPEWKFERQQRIIQGTSTQIDEKTLVVLQAAERWKKTYLHPPDYFSLLPIDDNGLSRDPSWVIPQTFIPIPIGGTIAVEGVPINTAAEPKLQTLANFLPGGYKFRWLFNLWYGEWIPVPNREFCADISDLSRNADDLGTLEDNLSGRPRPSNLACFDPKNTHLINPRAIKVQSGQEHFHLTPNMTRVKNPNDGPGGIRLVREPSSAIQTYDLIVDHKNYQNKIKLIEDNFGIQDISFGEKDLLRLFYSNMVNCYPSSDTFMNRPPVSINLKFFDRERNRYSIPTVKLHTQGISIKGVLNKFDIQRMIHKVKEVNTYEEHYWRLVYRLLWRELFLNRRVSSFAIDFSFDCIKILKALRFIDYISRTKHNTTIELLDNVEINSIYQEGRSECNEFQFDLFDSNIISLIPANWADIKNIVLARARSELSSEIAESYAQSLAMATCRDAADKTNTNLDLIKTSVEVYEGDEENYIFHICIYDNIEGGNGTTSSYVEQIHHKISFKKICDSERSCDTDNDERIILSLLQEQSFNADTLYSLTRTHGELIKYGLSGQGIFKISRLISSPSITAFYQGVAENYKVLKDLLGREPGEEELACFLKERPIADPRGNQLFEHFKKQRGGISELIPRISEIMPLCHGSCPDCLGDSRLSFEKGEKIIPDRNLLGDWLK